MEDPDDRQPVPPSAKYWKGQRIKKKASGLAWKLHSTECMAAAWDKQDHRLQKNVQIDLCLPVPSCIVELNVNDAECCQTTILVLVTMIPDLELNKQKHPWCQSALVCGHKEPQKEYVAVLNGMNVIPELDHWKPFSPLLGGKNGQCSEGTLPDTDSDAQFDHQSVDGRRNSWAI